MLIKEAKKFNEYHEDYVKERVKNLTTLPAKRKAFIILCHEIMNIQMSLIQEKREVFFRLIAQNAKKLHQHHHTVDKKTNIKVSFGVVRMSNIQPCIHLTRYLLTRTWPDDIEIRTMAYHSRQLLLLRHVQEKHLDKVLKRKEKPHEQPVAFHDNHIRHHLDSIAENQAQVKHILFILVATPVEEVGRDHDFDWAIIEPSSYRSIIQLAGRVRRHREGEITIPNIGILQYNWRTIKEGDEERKPRFYFPGYERTENLSNNIHGCFKTHDLNKLIDQELIQSRLDATPRIQEKPEKSITPMALLEHAVIQNQLTHYEGVTAETLQGYLKYHWHLTALSQFRHRFRQGSEMLQLYKIVNVQGDAWFTKRDPRGKFVRDVEGNLLNIDSHLITMASLTDKEKERLWMQRDYMQLLQKKSQDLDISLEKAAIDYGEVSLDFYSGSDKYVYDDALGLYKKEREDI